MTLRRIAVAACALSSLLAVAPAGAGAAVARQATSSNWAGYAVSRSGTRFHKVTGSWVQPAATCAPGRRAFSAYWLGLGGFHRSSRALEQIGTEADCSSRGRPFYLAWYEIVPAAPVTIPMTVRPGDSMSASVTVRGRSTTVRLVDVTRGRQFVAHLRASRVDVASAEWVVEAPSACARARCRTLPLANFGSAGFSQTLATTTGGHRGTITDTAWTATAIALRADARGSLGGRFVSDSDANGATPGDPTPAGDGFTVTYVPGSGA